LARTIIGGLTTSTLITLVVIPVVYSIVEERVESSRSRRLVQPEDLAAQAAGD